MTTEMKEIKFSNADKLFKRETSLGGGGGVGCGGLPLR